MHEQLISVIIPSRSERFLQKTVLDLLNKSRGEIEILVALDGYWPPAEEIVNDKRVRYIHWSTPQGMRAVINMAAMAARGMYLLKSDGHCMFDEGFDIKLKQHVPEYVNDYGDDNWIVIPRRHRLDAEKWELQEVNKPPVDYEYLSSPADKGAKGCKWDDRTMSRKDILIDETISFQGSCWFMTRSHYIHRLGGMNPDGYGQFVREAQELGLKTWLTGGRVYVNKHTWYAHLHKGKKYGRGYFLNSKDLDKGNAYCDDFWFNNRLKGAKYDLAWLIKHFSPMPSWTPELIEKVRRYGNK